MSRLLGNAQWSRQPQVAVGIDWANPITRGLVVCIDGAMRRDMARNLFPTTNTAPQVTAEAGKALNFGGTSGTQHIYNSLPVSAGSLSIAMVFTPAAADNVTIACLAKGSGGGSDYNHSFYINSDGTITFYHAISGVYSRHSDSSGAASLNKENVVVGVYSDNTGSTIYLNNSQGDSTAFTGSVTGINTAYIGGLMDASGATGEYYTGTVGLFLVWSRELSRAEAASISENPWQVFAPLRRVAFPVSSAAAPQLLASISDLSAGGWTPSTGSDLYAMLDESAYSDADYIVSTTASSCEMRVATGTDPAVSTGHVLRYRLLAGSGSIAVALKQGSTTIASFGPHTLTGSAQDFAQTLSGAEADSITDYSDLRVVFTAS
jgi:hypothetical protein